MCSADLLFTCIKHCKPLSHYVAPFLSFVGDLLVFSFFPWLPFLNPLLSCLSFSLPFLSSVELGLSVFSTCQSRHTATTTKHEHKSLIESIKSYSPIRSLWIHKPESLWLIPFSQTCWLVWHCGWHSTIVLCYLSKAAPFIASICPQRQTFLVSSIKPSDFLSPLWTVPSCLPIWLLEILNVQLRYKLSLFWDSPSPNLLLIVWSV